MAQSIQVGIRSVEGKLEVKAREAVALVGRAPDGSDAPEAFRAGELVLGALGTCTVGTVLAHARERGIALTSVRAEVIGREVDGPARIESIEVILHLEGDLTREEREDLEVAGQGCKIHNTLSHGIPIAVRLSPSR
jgi:uncharacterized OsmC-like protein